MSTKHEYTPTTWELLKKYVYQGGTPEEFYRWYDGEMATAEQRGSEEGWDEGYWLGINEHTGLRNPYRADQEGDDA